MNPETVLVICDYLLPHIEASRHMAHQLIPRIPTDVLTIRPVADGESIGVLAWTVAGSYAGHLSRTRGQALHHFHKCAGTTRNWAPFVRGTSNGYVWHAELGWWVSDNTPSKWTVGKRTLNLYIPA